MPEVNRNSKAKSWGPPSFPVAGRLPAEASVVSINYHRQTSEKDLFRQQTNERGQKQHSECCRSLHISLFFDGTNNNENNDTKKNHPSNIAKLFHASLRGGLRNKKVISPITCQVSALHFPRLASWITASQG